MIDELSCEEEMEENLMNLKNVKGLLENHLRIEDPYPLREELIKK